MKTPSINAILRKTPVSCKYGAPMGRRNHCDADSPLYLQRILFVDGDYAPDGTYWGGGSALWCAFNGEDDQFAAAAGTQIYVRAVSRADAMRDILDRHPGVVFRKH